MNRLPIAKRAQILNLLVEGNSLRAASRIADVSINTVYKLLIDAGEACLAYQDQAFRNLPCKRLQLDEIWSFVYTKQRKVMLAKAAPRPLATFGPGLRSVPIPSSCRLGGLAIGVAQRQSSSSATFRTGSRTEFRSPAMGIAPIWKPLRPASVPTWIMPNSSSCTARFRIPPAATARRKSRETKTFCCTGNPDPQHISTSYVERQNLTMRMSMRRFTRLTNASAKRSRTTAHAMSLHYMHYNFVRIHRSLRITPAMAAGVTDRLWSIEEIAALAP